MDINNIKKYVFSYIKSNMYIIEENCSALVIDPNISEEALNYLKGCGVTEVVILLTHEHYDHTSGLIWMCDEFKSTVICHEETAKSLRIGKNSHPVIIASSHMAQSSNDEIKEIVGKLPQKYKYNPDIVFDYELNFRWQTHEIKMISTPGHSKGSCCIEIDGNVVATGDSLILNTLVITRFPGGSAEQYKNITVPYLKKLPENTFILPGHGNTFYIKEVQER